MGTLRTVDKTWPLFPGFCALMRPGGIYDAEQDENNPLGITYIHFDWVKSKRSKKRVTREVSEDWPEFFNIKDLAFIDAMSRKIVEHFPRTPEIATLLMDGLLVELSMSPPMRNDFTQETTLNRRILQTVAEIHSGVTSAPASVAGMARKFHLSQSHFSRLFKKVTGQSPIEFLLQVRLAQARHLLRETDLSVGAIAEHLGYRDLYFFSRQFTQKEGL